MSVFLFSPVISKRFSELTEVYQISTGLNHLFSSTYVHIHDFAFFIWGYNTQYQMLYNYVTTTNDTSILTRALPLAEVRQSLNPPISPFSLHISLFPLSHHPTAFPSLPPLPPLSMFSLTRADGSQNELSWWRNNRTIEVRSSYTNQTYDMARYAVTNSAPRPESYLTGAFRSFKFGFPLSLFATMVTRHHDHSPFSS